MNGHFESIFLQGQEVRCVVHSNDNTHELHVIPDAKLEPALLNAIDALEDCIEGLLIKKWRANLEGSIPENIDPGDKLKFGFCKICNEPIAADDTGVRQHGPFLYCPKHSAL